MGLRDNLRCLRCQVNLREPLCKYCVERVHGAELALEELQEKLDPGDVLVRALITEMMFSLRSERRPAR